MHIGIIVHSFTGNTLQVAERIRDSLAARHNVEVKRIQIVGGEQQNMTQFQIADVPGIEEYDAVIFGAPVRGFSVSPVIASYLKGLPELKEKTVVCFVTKSLANNWTGGNKAIRSMQGICESKGGQVVDTGIVYWKETRREDSLNRLVERISQLF
jgi:flavodoxin